MSELWRVWLPVYKGSIQRACAEHGLEPVKLAALVWQESAGGVRLIPGEGIAYNPRFLYRYEPKFWERYLAGKPEWAPPPGAEEGAALELWKRRVSASYGITQVMFPVACEIVGDPAGLDLEPEELLAPGFCLDLACRHLKRSMGANWTWRGALARYNTGRTRPDLTQYDDEVIAKEEALVSGGALEILG